jgi:hypothetical protein
MPGPTRQNFNKKIEKNQKKSKKIEKQKKKGNRRWHLAFFLIFGGSHFF